MFCKSCGNELKEGAKVCDKCGARLTPSAGNISGAAAGNSNAAKTFSFKIHAKGRSSIFNTIKQFRGAYKADFTVEDNRLLIDETDNYGETVSSVPYYLIKEFSLKESISPMLIFTYLICALVAIALLATGTEILTGILVLIVLVLFMIFLGFKNARFLLTLNDNQKIKILADGYSGLCVVQSHFIGCAVCIDCKCNVLCFVVTVRRCCFPQGVGFSGS